jgi:phage-related protein (TIGR01555 family)
MLTNIRNYVTDGWNNILSGLGRTNTDKTKSTIIDTYTVLNDESLATIYDSNGLGANIVDIPADDMTRAGWEIENDTDDKISNELNRIGAETKINEALKKSRLYRGSVVVIITERGKLEQPLTQNSGKIINLRTYGADRIVLTSTDIVDDPNSVYFEDVEWFTIRLVNGDDIKVHRTRCLKFKGVGGSGSTQLDLTNQFWGFSALQKPWDQLTYYGAAEQGVATLIQEASVGKYTLSNLSQILSMNSPDSVKAIMDRIEIINASKSIINAVLLGKDEDYVRDSINFAGIPDILDRMMQNLSAVSKIPAALLFGRDSSGGLNNDGSAEFRKYYDKISTAQTSQLLPELQYLVDYVSGYLFINSNEQYNVEFNSLWEPTQKEQAEIDKINSETDVNYINSQVLTPEEVTEKRFPNM